MEEEHSSPLHSNAMEDTAMEDIKAKEDAEAKEDTEAKENVEEKVDTKGKEKQSASPSLMLSPCAEPEEDTYEDLKLEIECPAVYEVMQRFLPNKVRSTASREEKAEYMNSVLRKYLPDQGDKLKQEYREQILSNYQPLQPQQEIYQYSHVVGSFSTKMIQVAPQPAPHCPCPCPEINSGYSWGIPIGLVLFCALMQARYTSRVFRGNKTQLVIEYAFIVNLAIEAGVAMRCQFPHTFDIIRINCIVTTVSASLATIVLLFDIYKKNQKFAPLGRGGIVHSGWVVKMRHWFVNLYHLVTGIGWANYVRIGFQLAQLVFRVLELLMRYKLPTDGSSIIPVYIITNDFSIVPLIFATATWIPRLMEEQQKVIKSMNIMVLGYESREQQQANEIPDPSPLVHCLLDFIPHPTTNLKCFDLWSTTVNRNQRELTLNLWEIRGNTTAYVDTTKWRLPTVDFIVLYFSLIDNAGIQSAENRWRNYIRKCAPRVPIVLVGTNLDEREQRRKGHTGLDFTTSAQGEGLALRIRAVAYIECNLQHTEEEEALVDRLAQLMI